MKQSKRDVYRKLTEMALPAEECLSRWYHVTGQVGLEEDVVLANHNKDSRRFPIQMNRLYDTGDKLLAHQTVCYYKVHSCPVYIWNLVVEIMKYFVSCY